MGTHFRIVLYAADPREASDAARAAFARIGELDAICSDYDGKSELNRACLSATLRPTPVSADLWRILVRSEELSEMSDGAFDVTVGPIVRLWRRAKRQGKLPTEARRIKALEAVGYRKLRLLPQGRQIELLHPDMKLDLGGIAKGYAAGAALAVLRARGIERALVDGGGDMALGEPPPDRTGWRIGLALPPAPDLEGTGAALCLARAGIATSGDAFRHVEIDGRRYSHIVDPRTGIGLTTRCNVTVIAPDPATADALASAASVLGPERGIPLVERIPGAEVLIRRIEEGEIRSYASRGFPALRAPGCAPGDVVP